MPFFISDTDITQFKADAIVNAANTDLRMGGGVCGAIFKAAGVGEMTVACQKLSPIQTGEAVMTPGFSLRARYVIHTAGPVWGETVDDEALLYRCYQSALKVAYENKCKTVIFPLISAGIYGCPKDTAKRIARKSILDFLDLHDEMSVTLILFEGAGDTKMQRKYASLYEEMDELFPIADLATSPAPARRLHTKDSISEEARMRLCSPHPAEGICHVASEGAIPFASNGGAAELPPEPESTFSEVLFRFIDEKGLTDPEVYKAANLDRRLFSKFRSVREYTPKKMTVLALAVALRLTVPQTETLLDAAGYSLSRHRRADVIVRWFMERNLYDIYEINDMLLAFHQKQLGQ